MNVAGIASALVGVAVLSVAAYLHPGRLRGLAIATVALGVIPFWDGAIGAMALVSDAIAVQETWRAAILAALVLLAAGGAAFFLATVRVEPLWPLAAIPVLAGIVFPAFLDPSALIAAVALPAIVRGGFGDPAWWRRIGAGISMLLLVVVNVLVVISLFR